MDRSENGRGPAGVEKTLVETIRGRRKIGRKYDY